MTIVVLRPSLAATILALALPASALAANTPASTTPAPAPACGQGPSCRDHPRGGWNPVDPDCADLPDTGLGPGPFDGDRHRRHHHDHHDHHDQADVHDARLGEGPAEHHRAHDRHPGGLGGETFQLDGRECARAHTRAFKRLGTCIDRGRRPRRDRRPAPARVRRVGVRALARVRAALADIDAPRDGRGWLSHVRHLGGIHRLGEARQIVRRGPAGLLKSVAHPLPFRPTGAG